MVTISDFREGALIVYENGTIACCDISHQQQTLWINQDIAEQGLRLSSSLKAFADRNSMRLIASSAEPQLPACSWLSGDALADQVFSPCAVQEKSYLYGMNSTHLAASAADNYGSKFVACELFRDYARVDARIAYQDTLNAFGHGANLIMAHADTGRPMFNRTLVDRLHMKLTGTNGRYTYSEFVARIQALLRDRGTEIELVEI